MGKISCNVFQDLLPLYIDEVASSDSRILLDGHLRECSKCREKYEEMRTQVTIPMDKDDLPLKRMKKVWNRKKVMLVCITLVAALLIMISGLMAIEEFVYEEQIAYNGSVYTLENSVVPTLPENSGEIGYIMGIASWCTTSPTIDFMATNMDGKYGGCILYQDPDNLDIIYLQDSGGCFLLFKHTGPVKE